MSDCDLARSATRHYAVDFLRSYSCTYKRAKQVIVRDDRCGDIFEALVGTLKAAKKRKVIDFKAELLLQAVYLAMHVYLGH
ncbi:hypothetical protein BASA61_009713 [Batrachochytrium salamandrivorans]|nr:hypothetical protein BASA61_009713 [Batrachochytrium salamandrivorans]